MSQDPIRQAVPAVFVGVLTAFLLAACGGPPPSEPGRQAGGGVTAAGGAGQPSHHAQDQTDPPADGGRLIGKVDAQAQAATVTGSSLQERPPMPIAPGDRLGHNSMAATVARAWHQPMRVIDWESPVLTAGLRELGLGAMRFPCGRDANAYHWDIDQYAYPFIHPDKEPDVGFVNMVELPIKVNADGFLRMTRDQGIEPFVVANIYQRDRPPVIGWLDSLAATFDGTVPFRYLELGNELETWATTHANDQGLASFEDYRARARPIADHVHQHHPGVEVAINVFGPFWHHNHRVIEPQKAKDWNSAAAADTSWYDAIVMHAYVNLRPGDFDKHSEASLRWGFAQGDVKAAAFPAYAASYFGDKPIWLTEYGILQDQWKRHWVYTMVNFNFLFQLLGNKGQIRHMLHHLVINVQDKQPLQTSVSAETVTSAELTHGWGTLYRSVYRVYDTATQVAAVDALGGGSFAGESHLADQTFPNVRGVALIDAAGARTYLLINRSPTAEAIALPGGRWRVTQHFAGVTDHVTDMQVEAAVHDGATTLACRPYSLIMIEPVGAE